MLRGAQRIEEEPLRVLTVPAARRSLPGIRRWLEQERGDSRLDPECHARLEDAVLEACQNAIDLAGCHGGPAPQMRLTAWLLPNGLRIDLQHEHHLAAALIRDEERRHQGLGLPRMAGLVDELTVTRLGGGSTLISLLVRGAG